MKALYRISAILVTLFVCCSCEKFPLGLIYDVQYEIAYQNSSNHTLNIVCDSEYYQYPQTFEILQDEQNRCLLMFSFFISGNNSDQRDARAQKLIVPETVTVVYDNEYSITFSRGAEMDNLCNISDYKKDQCYQHATLYYTFTEEDYKYAKTYGVKLDD